MGRIDAGTEVGSYVVIEPIATGGMAEVYRVRDRVTGEHHALKALVHPEGRAMFDREYEAMNRLNHPSVVRTYLYGRHQDMPWLSMELLDGVTGMRHVKSAGRVGEASTVEAAIRLVALVARALHYVHQRGILHRDVKSGNVIVLPDGRVKLFDFGVAWLGEPGQVAPPLSQVVGTPSYLAPELIRCKPYDHRVDLYALGVMLYGMLTGKKAFKADSAEGVMRQHLEAPVPDPRDRIPQLPETLAALVMALLDKDPRNRPRHAGVVANHLDALLGSTILPGTAIALHRSHLLTGEEPLLDAHDTALAVGRMVGRRAPVGALARRFHEVTSGRPSAITEVVEGLVDLGTIEANGNQLQWDRAPFTLEVPPGLTREITERYEACPPQQKMVLKAVALVPGIRRAVLRTRFPASTGALDAAVDRLLETALVREEDGALFPASGPVGRVISEALTGSGRTPLERLLSAKPTDLPVCPLRIRAMIREGSIREALADAVTQGHRLALEGRWEEAHALLHEVYLEASHITMGEELGELLLLYARTCAVTLAAEPHAMVRALSTARRVAVDPVSQARCDLTEAELQLTLGHYRNFEKRLEGAAERGGLDDAPEVRGELALARIQSALWTGRLSAAERALEAIQLDALPDPLHARLLVRQARCAVERGMVQDAEELGAEAMTRSAEGTLPWAEGLRVWADALRYQGRFSEAISELRRAASQLRTRPDPRGYTEVVLAIGWCEADLNRLGLAQECVEELTAAIRRREHLHLRLQRDLLSGTIALRSGQAAPACYPLEQVAKLAKSAGLRELERAARTALVEAQLLAGLPSEDLDRWYTNHRLGFLGEGWVWPYAEAVRVYVAHHPSRPDPDAVYAPLLSAIGSEPARPLRVEQLLARSTHRLASSPQEALLASRDAARLVAEINRSLDTAESGAFRVHPWKHRIRRALEGARRGSSAPAARR